MDKPKTKLGKQFTRLVSLAEQMLLAAKAIKDEVEEITTKPPPEAEEPPKTR